MATSAFKSLTVTYESGERIVAAGERGACMFVVGSGKVRLLRADGEGAPSEVAVLEKGDFFGEMALLEGSPYGVDAESIGRCEVVEITPGVFQKMLESSSEMAVRMLRKLGGRLERAESRLAGSRDHAPAGEQGETLATTSTAVQTGRLVVENGKGDFALVGDELLVGRYDPVTEIQPEIDLSAHDAKRSVSRRHARLQRTGDTWLLQEEVGVLNGTYRNGVRLEPGSPVRLRDGDTVSFGMVRMVFREA